MVECMTKEHALRVRDRDGPFVRKANLHVMSPIACENETASMFQPPHLWPSNRSADKIGGMFAQFPLRIDSPELTRVISTVLGQNLRMV